MKGKGVEGALRGNGRGSRSVHSVLGMAGSYDPGTLNDEL